MIFNLSKLIIINMRKNIIFEFCKLLCLIKHIIYFLSKINVIKSSYTLKDVELTLLIRKLLLVYLARNLVDHNVVALDK
jgi:hypothetical protein